MAAGQDVGSRAVLDVDAPAGGQAPARSARARGPCAMKAAHPRRDAAAQVVGARARRSSGPRAPPGSTPNSRTAASFEVRL